MAKDTSDIQARAAATFKRKEQQAREGAKAMADYEAEAKAMRAKTERLRALRLARDAAAGQAAPAPGKKKSAKKKPSGTLAGFLKDQQGGGRNT